MDEALPCVECIQEMGFCKYCLPKLGLPRLKQPLCTIHAHWGLPTAPLDRIEALRRVQEELKTQLMVCTACGARVEKFEDVVITDIGVAVDHDYICESCSKVETHIRYWEPLNESPLTAERLRTFKQGLGILRTELRNLPALWETLLGEEVSDQLLLIVDKASQILALQMVAQEGILEHLDPDRD